MIDRIADGRTDLVFELQSHGHSIDAVDAGGVSVIEWCAYYGDVSAIRYLIENGEALESLGDNFDLNGAAFHGHWQLCQFLIENGADPDHPLPDTGETPLLSAASKAGRPGNTLVVKVLLANGADPNRPTKVGAETGAFMRDVRTRGETALHRAAAYGGEAVIRTLIEAGADLTARDANGDSPLSWASWHKRPAYILELLCFDGHTVHPEAVRTSRKRENSGHEAMDEHLLGKPRF